MADLKEMLRKGHQDTQWSMEDLWFHYRLAGGERTLATLYAWFNGKDGALPPIDQYDKIARVMNQRLRELGKEDCLLPELLPSYMS